jgi:uncharacterized protein
MYPVTSLYAGVLTVLYLGLSASVIVMRRREHISLGHGGNRILERRIRAHGNFAEYAPLGLVLLLLAEIQVHNSYWLYAVGGVLTLGRWMHASALALPRGSGARRVAGMVLTFTSLSLLAGTSVYAAFFY